MYNLDGSGSGGNNRCTSRLCPCFPVDSVNGKWGYTYDGFNRLSTSTCSLACPDGQATQGFTYAYDRYGNRWNQTVTAGSGPQPSFTFWGPGNVPNNRVDTYSYDAEGNLLNDGVHSYTYDAENRIKAVDGSGTTYIYDADGQRVEKTSASDHTGYIYDRLGQMFLRTNFHTSELYAGGLHLGTSVINAAHTASTFYFTHSDWLGTERVRTTPTVTGVVCWTAVSLAFGDGQATSGSCADNGGIHFTGTERDTESNLDEFGARYFASTMGRFMTPDWAARPTAVPYAVLGDPQSLNLYGYVRNDPISRADLDGHGGIGCDQGGSCEQQIPGTDSYTTAQNADSISMGFSLFNSSGGIWEDSPANVATSSGQTVGVTYEPDAPAMQPKTAEYVEKVAVAAGVESINIFATTNGKHDSPRSNHYNGTAVDINEVNGEHVIKSRTDSFVFSNVQSIQNTANNPKVGVAHENYGPAGLYRNGKQFSNKRLQDEHENHIHITIPRDDQ
jgi:RHS repeat-associated protein